jgi:hypothetical protein
MYFIILCQLQMMAEDVATNKVIGKPSNIRTNTKRTPV